MRIGNRDFDFKRKYIMGILNVTPDSFSDGGKFVGFDKAVEHGIKLFHHGADILDIGGESTRPENVPISSEEEMERIIKVIEKLKREIDIPISVDTYKHDVAEEAIKSGACFVNDVWGFKKDKNMAHIVKKYDVPCCLMHNRENRNYNDFIKDCLNDLKGSIQIAIDAGISRDKVMIDPGIGFAKDFDENIIVLKNLQSFCELGYPVILGTSRKRFLGKLLNIDKASDRTIGSVASSIIGIMKGCCMVRVHDVLEHKQAIKVYEAIK
ncbi:MAG: dihydropteroate synthase [Oscillospiraceae bacterium]|nr:dihydropteroate synthase [Oscillospiraceae bacterium]